MSFPTDLEIAHSVKALPISEIAEKLNIDLADLEYYGKGKKKIPLHYIQPDKIQKSKLILIKKR